MVKNIIHKKVDWTQDLLRYRKSLALIEADVPIEVLCMPENIESILKKAGYTRVFDLLGQKFTKIKGIGVKRAQVIFICLSQFIPIS